MRPKKGRLQLSLYSPSFPFVRPASPKGGGRRGERGQRKENLRMDKSVLLLLQCPQGEDLLRHGEGRDPPGKGGDEDEERLLPPLLILRHKERREASSLSPMLHQAANLGKRGGRARGGGFAPIIDHNLGCCWLLPSSARAIRYMGDSCCSVAVASRDPITICVVVKRKHDMLQLQRRYVTSPLHPLWRLYA